MASRALLSTKERVCDRPSNGLQSIHILYPPMIKVFLSRNASPIKTCECQRCCVRMVLSVMGKCMSVLNRQTDGSVRMMPKLGPIKPEQDAIQQDSER